MFGLLLLAVFGLWVLLYQKTVNEVEVIPARIADRLDKLWQIASESIHERKYLRAEKALLTILRVDERNSTAYNRLGILYAKQREYDDSIECFEIAQSLDPSASSLHNIGLIYYETGKYDKASLAFEQAITQEGDLATRHIAYAKVQEKLGHMKKMIEALERAVELEPNPQSLGILADAYERVGEEDLALKIREKLARIIIPEGTPQRIKQPPRRVVM